MGNYVKLSKVVEKLNLKNLTPDVDMTEKKVMVPDINRPALQLTGFFEHFAYERVQLIGCVEYTFLENVEEDEKEKPIYRVDAGSFAGAFVSHCQRSYVRHCKDHKRQSVPGHLENCEQHVHQSDLDETEEVHPL